MSDELERMRENRNEWRRISAEQQADYGRLVREVERLEGALRGCTLQRDVAREMADANAVEVERLRKLLRGES